ncbi:MAG TPA: hypothetical protein VIW94_00485 [Acidimicrobiia bacterium]
MFEAVEFVEVSRLGEPRQTLINEFADEASAVEAARQARKEFLETGSDDYAWWIVRKSGATLAEFIADSKSNKEFVLDITSGQLVEV